MQMVSGWPVCGACGLYALNPQYLMKICLYFLMILCKLGLFWWDVYCVLVAILSVLKWLLVTFQFYHQKNKRLIPVLLMGVKKTLVTSMYISHVPLPSPLSHHWIQWVFMGFSEASVNFSRNLLCPTQLEFLPQSTAHPQPPTTRLPGKAACVRY